ncbi:hypothetical protein TNCV_3761431 [Trichonephila clavipes]|nr:hypothetical protein TNCV_3761431 [Trichonephila clavipes]
MSYEVAEQQWEQLNHPPAVREDSVQDSKFILAENGTGVSDFHLTFYKRSDDSHLCDEQQFSYLTLSTTFKRFFSSLGLLRAFVDQHHV